MVEDVRHRLKELRNRVGLRSRDVAQGLGMAPSTYQKYEDRRKGSYLPLEMVAKLVVTLEPHGISPEEVWNFANTADVEIFHRAWALKKESKGSEKREVSSESKVIKYNSERRRHERRNPFPANLRVDGLRGQCVVKNISVGGACVISYIARSIKDNMGVILEFSFLGETKAKVVHCEGDEIGLMFTNNAEQAIADRLMTIGDSHHSTE